MRPYSLRVPEVKIAILQNHAVIRSINRPFTTPSFPDKPEAYEGEGLPDLFDDPVMGRNIAVFMFPEPLCFNKQVI